MTLNLLVFINQSPWNELILRDKRPVKYGGNKINHVGLVLLYTSKSKPDPEGVADLLYELPDGTDASAVVEDIPRGFIVGACMFRCVQGRGVQGRGEYEYHLSDARRFANPVPITKRGPVRFYTTEVTPLIERELRRVRLWRKAVESNRER